MKLVIVKTILALVTFSVCNITFAADNLNWNKFALNKVNGYKSINIDTCNSFSNVNPILNVKNVEAFLQISQDKHVKKQASIMFSTYIENYSEEKYINTFFDLFEHPKQIKPACSNGYFSDSLIKLLEEIKFRKQVSISKQNQKS